MSFQDSTTGTATRLDEMPGWKGDAWRYRMDPPLEDNEFVIVSAANTFDAGPETYIFPADVDGGPTLWGELSGSQRGTLNHEAVLSELGYRIVREAQS